MGSVPIWSESVRVIPRCGVVTVVGSVVVVIVSPIVRSNVMCVEKLVVKPKDILFSLE